MILLNMECSDILVVSGMAFEAKMLRLCEVKTVYGLDTSKLESDIENAIHRGAKAILSFGTAAGISPILEAGIIVIAKTVRSNMQVFSADEKWTNNLILKLTDAVCGETLGVDKPIFSKGEKASLWQTTHAIAVDMESHHVARIAAKFGLPFAVLRVVIDSANIALPYAAQVSTNLDGTINYAKLIRSLLSKPKQLGAMLKLGSDHAKAKKSLSRSVSLLRDCRFGMHFPSSLDIS